MDLPSVPPELNKNDSPSLLIDNFVEEESYDVLYTPSFYSAQEVQRLGIPDHLSLNARTSATKGIKEGGFGRRSGIPNLCTSCAE